MLINGITYLSLTLKECESSDLVPVFEIDNGYTRKTIYRYAGKLWEKDNYWTVQKIRAKVQAGQLNESVRYKIEQDWLAAGNSIYTPAVEPFYWLDTSSSTANGMVRVSCREDGFLESRRRFTHREREDAISCANAIIKLVYNEKRDPTEKWNPSIIHVLPAYYESEVPTI